MVKEPKCYRSSYGHVFGWEIYDWGLWAFNFCIGTFEIQFNKWR